MNRIIGLGLIALCLALPAFAQPFTLLSSFGENNNCDGGVVIDGTTLFACQGSSGLRSMDISDPTMPLTLDQNATEGVALDVIKRGSYTYLCDYEYLRTYNVSDPSNMVQTGVYYNWGPENAAVAVDNYLYQSFLTETCRVFSLSDPSDPGEVRQFLPGGVNSFHRAGQYVVAGREADWVILDATSPSNPALETTVPTGVEVNDVWVYMDHAYAAAGDDIIVYDMSDVNDVTELLTLPFANVKDLCIEDGLLFGVSNDGELRAYALDNPASPFLYATHDTGGQAWRVAAGEGLVVVSNHSSFQIYELLVDAAFLSGQVTDSELGLGIAGVEVNVDGTVVTSDDGGYYSFGAAEDLQPGTYTLTTDRPGYEPASVEVTLTIGATSEDVVLLPEPGPFAVGDHLGVSGDVVDVVLKDGYAVVGSTDPFGELSIVDVTDPTSLEVYYSANLTATPTMLDLDGNRLVVALETYGFYVYNVANLPTIIQLGSQTFLGSPLAVAADDGLCVMGTMSAGIAIYDISVPSNIQFLANLGAATPFGWVDVAGDIAACVATDMGQVYILNLSNPSAPSVSTVMNLGGVERVRLVGSRMIANRGELGVEIYSLTTPNQPELLATLDTPGHAWASAPDGELLFVADGPRGLRGFSLDAISNPIDLGARVSPGSATVVQVEENTALVAEAGGLTSYDIGGTGVVSVVLEPFNPPVLIPPVGADFFFHLTVRNNRNETYAGSLRAYAVLPNDTWYSIVNQPIELAPGVELFFPYLRQTVPGFAPEGDYEFVVRFHQGDDVLDLDQFPFTKLGWDATAQGAWTLHGLDRFQPVSATETTLPITFAMSPLAPNPFNGMAAVTVDVPEAQPLTVELFNLTGQRVRTLHEGQAEAGRLQLAVRGDDLASGVYLLRASLAGHGTHVRKAVLVK